MSRHLRSLLSRPLTDWLLLFEAGVLLLAARLALRLMPVSRIVLWIQRPLHGKATATGSMSVQRCRWAVTSFSRNAPVRLVCFPQALALHAMLRRRGIMSEVLYGVARLANSKLAAHAWLRHQGEVIVGGETAGDFSVLDVWHPAVSAADGPGELH